MDPLSIFTAVTGGVGLLVQVTELVRQHFRRKREESSASSSSSAASAQSLTTPAAEPYNYYINNNNNIVNHNNSINHSHINQYHYCTFLNINDRANVTVYVLAPASSQTGPHDLHASSSHRPPPAHTLSLPPQYMPFLLQQHNANNDNIDTHAHHLPRVNSTPQIYPPPLADDQDRYSDMLKGLPAAHQGRVTYRELPLSDAHWTSSRSTDSGFVQLVEPDVAFYPDYGYWGVMTRRQMGYGMQDASHHWRSLQQREDWKSIAVLDWANRNIDMFVENQGSYFHNYKVLRCDVVGFAAVFQKFQVFSGVVENNLLVRCNDTINMVEEGIFKHHSTNSWRYLSIQDEFGYNTYSNGQTNDSNVFVEVSRGAVVGIICSLYEAPHDLNLVMSRYDDDHFLGIHQVASSPPKKKMTRCFSVFGINSKEWATQKVFVGI